MLDEVWQDISMVDKHCMEDLNTYSRRSSTLGLEGDKVGSDLATDARKIGVCGARAESML